jgi:predicted transcriptional regulator
MNTNLTSSSVPNEKTTIYLDPRVKKSVQYYALRDASSLSQIINQKLTEYLEDQADLAALADASKETDDFVSLDQVMKELVLDKDDIRRQAEAERPQAA